MTRGPNPSGRRLEGRIRARADAAGIPLSAEWVNALALHLESVLAANDRLHLTTVTDLDRAVERHVGESLEGAALIDPDRRGILLDLGSGNGYPGLPIAAARPGLDAILVESSTKKAAFLRELVRKGPFADVKVLARQVQRSADLEDFPRIGVLTSRAMGNWPRVLPRLASRLAEGGYILLWAGEKVEEVLGRAVWRGFALAARRPIPGTHHSWVWKLIPAKPTGAAH